MADLSRLTFGALRSGNAGDAEKMIVPPVNVFSRNGDLVVRAEVPGVNPERDIEVLVQDGVLVIRGERRQEDREERENYLRVESTYGAFQRSIPLPQGVKEEDIRASYENGILEVVVPGAAQSTTPKKIPIVAGSKVTALNPSGQKKK
jgi:HSP20 family protein